MFGLLSISDEMSIYNNNSSLRRLSLRRHCSEASYTFGRKSVLSECCNAVFIPDSQSDLASRLCHNCRLHPQLLRMPSQLRLTSCKRFNIGKKRRAYLNRPKASKDLYQLTVATLPISQEPPETLRAWLQLSARLLYDGEKFCIGDILDLIYPTRLEMGHEWIVRRGGTVYQYLQVQLQTARKFSYSVLTKADSVKAQILKRRRRVS
jgi:hypothetical protein